MEINVLDLDDIKFEETCYYCYGSGQTSFYEGRNRKPTLAPCKTCEGGYVTTDLGKRLLAFLKKHDSKT